MERVLRGSLAAPMRMRQSLAQLERALRRRDRAGPRAGERLRREAERRARKRQLGKTHKRGSMRFGLLYLILIATAVLVTFAMFETLYYVMG